MAATSSKTIKINGRTPQMNGVSWETKPPETNSPHVDLKSAAAPPIDEHVRASDVKRLNLQDSTAEDE